MSVSARLSLFLALALTAYPLRALGQTIVTMNWGVGAQTISGDSDVSTAGTLVQATNLGDFSGWEQWVGSDFSTTLNGVTFVAVQVAPATKSMPVGAFTLAEDPHFLTSGGSTIPNQMFAAPTQNLSEAYRKLLVGHATTHLGEGEPNPGDGIDDSNVLVTLTMPNLTIGHSYQFQWWTALPEAAFNYVTLASGGLQLSSNTTGQLGGFGQFAIGTFTATDSTMFIEFWGLEYEPKINAFQMRDVTAVPEPSTYALIVGLAALGWYRVRRRRGVGLKRTGSGNMSGS